jgi:hypothetical protein
MADKSFGVKELNLLNASGTPTVTSPNNLNLNANTVAISTSATVGNNLTVTSTTTSANLNISGIATVVNFNATGISTIAQPADSNPMANWTITNNSASAYRFTGPGQSGTEDNPNIYLVRGHRYIFRHNATSNHPIQIRFANGGTAYTDGVTYSDTGNNRTTDGNNLIFNVQHDAPAQLFYQCVSHGGMVGNIYIVGGPQVISGVVTATTFVGNLTGTASANAVLTGSTNNQLVTVTGANAITGESNLTFDGSSSPASLGLTGDLNVVGGWPKINLQATQASGENYQIAGAIQGVTNQGFCIRNTTDSANVIEIDQDSSRNLKVVSGNVIIGTSGKGIDFSATANSGGTMSSELLDDYEEGSFTPILYYVSGTSGVAYSVQEGRYTKIGRLVSFQIRLALTSKGSGNNNVRIGGLPYVPSASGVNYDMFLISVIVGMNIGSGKVPFAQMEDYSVGRITLYSFDYSSSTNYAEINSTHIASNFTCSLQGNYVTAS